MKVRCVEFLLVLMVCVVLRDVVVVHCVDNATRLEFAFSHFTQFTVVLVATKLESIRYRSLVFSVSIRMTFPISILCFITVDPGSKIATMSPSPGPLSLSFVGI